MKVIYFERGARSPIHIHEGSYASCFYVPDENIVLYREQHGRFGGKDYLLTNRKEILEKARAIDENRTLNVDGVTFSNIKKFEYESSKLLELIKYAKLKAKLQTKVKAGIEDLLKYVGKSPKAN